MIEDKPGADTVLGTRRVAKAPEDGYMVPLTYSAHVQNPSLFSDIGYDSIKDFVAISEVAASSMILRNRQTSQYAPRTNWLSLSKPTQANTTMVPTSLA